MSPRIGCLILVAAFVLMSLFWAAVAWLLLR
jgi:hypothetical protein